MHPMNAKGMRRIAHNTDKDFNDSATSMPLIERLSLSRTPQKREALRKGRKITVTNDGFGYLAKE